MTSAKETIIDTSSNLKNKVIESSSTIKDKFDKMEIKEKIMTTGATAYTSAKGLGENVLDKGKELYVSFIYFLLYMKEFRNGAKY